VISQIFGGGGNAGAPFRNDFIEIFNAGAVTVNLAGWSVQYASATASTWSVTPLTSVALLPGQYYLIQESSGGSNGALLPAPDATGTIAMAATSGKVALVRNSTALSGACPNDPNIVDFVGYGTTANCFKGSAPAAAPSNTNAILRAASGCTNASNNAKDFSAGTPGPRNTLAPPSACTVARTRAK
jgi:predicted extracellular nuclease